MMGANHRAGLEIRDRGYGQSEAPLRVIMTAPPMSAAEYAAAARRRTDARRAVEEMRDRAAAEQSAW